jgi:hypothetical protein
MNFIWVQEGEKHMQSVTKDSFTHAKRYSLNSESKYFLVSKTFTSVEITLWMPYNWNTNI